MNASLRGDGLAFAIEPFPWDPSVKTLAQFPDVLRMLNDEWDWMVRVGNAFDLQESDVMESWCSACAIRPTPWEPCGPPIRAIRN